MKKLLTISLAAIAIAGYSQIDAPSTTVQQDNIAVLKANLVLIDTSYQAQTNAMYARYILQRNNILRQIEKQATTTNTPAQ